MKFKIIPIAGDASFRKFYRVILNKKSKIIVFAEKDKHKNLKAYIAINKFLRENKILAPKLLDYNYSEGIIGIEDFGDITFHKVLLKKKKRLNTYKKLIDLLIKIQKIKPNRSIKIINKNMYTIKKYSNKYLLKESNLFFDWYLPLFLTRKKSLNIKKKTNKLLIKIYKKLNFTNSCFVHRDYHVQNLMKVGKKIGVIDSQDALIGNPAYDLASIIDDVRIKNSKKIKNEIYSYYLKKKSREFKKNSHNFLEDFEILSVQRSLKIIGIFSRLFVRDKKKQYLKLIPYAWKLLEMRMHSKIFSDLRFCLNTNIPSKFKKRIIY